MPSLMSAFFWKRCAVEAEINIGSEEYGVDVIYAHGFSYPDINADFRNHSRLPLIELFRHDCVNQIS